MMVHGGMMGESDALGVTSKTQPVAPDGDQDDPNSIAKGIDRNELIMEAARIVLAETLTKLGDDVTPVGAQTTALAQIAGGAGKHATS